MTYVIAASPLAKIFQNGFAPGPQKKGNRWHELLMAKPERCFEEEPFDVHVTRFTGDVIIPYGVPKQILGKNDQETQTLIEWLTGSDDGMRSPETLCYGIVKFDADIDVMGSIASLMELDAAARMGDKAAEKKKTKLEGEITPMIGRARERAKKLSHERVMTQIRIVYRNLMDQYEKNREAGVGLYTPSATEYLSTYVLRQEIEQANDSQKEMNQAFAKMLSETGMRGGAN